MSGAPRRSNGWRRLPSPSNILRPFAYSELREGFGENGPPGGSGSVRTRLHTPVRGHALRCGVPAASCARLHGVSWAFWTWPGWSRQMESPGLAAGLGEPR